MKPMNAPGTPVWDFVHRYADQQVLRLHMPGHKGRGWRGHPFSQVFPWDITEIKGADSLFEANGIIEESEKNASRLFGTGRTLYSAGGSTLCIQAMLALYAKPGGVIVAARNAHKAFFSACILMDFRPEWVYSREGAPSPLLSCDYTPEDVRKAVRRAGKPSCVYLTSPDYFGRTADIAGISAVCREEGVPLLVDNAHGAHLAFLEPSRHPIALGADACCDSAHKTLPALTGAAYLHLRDEQLGQRAKDAMALFGSTSPSYIILASLDLCNQYLWERGAEDAASMERWRNRLQERLSGQWDTAQTDPSKLTLLPGKQGVTGTWLAEELRKKGAECEYADQDSAVLLFSPVSGGEDFQRTEKALLEIRGTLSRPAVPLQEEAPRLPRLERCMTLREAAFAPSENIPAEQAAGRICAMTRVSCPPGVPIAAGGEILNQDCIKILKRYGISQVNVVK